MSAPTNGAAVLDAVREARAEAVAKGHKPPGRRALANQLGLSVHHVRQAIDALPEEEQPPANAASGAHDAAQSEAGDRPGGDRAPAEPQAGELVDDQAPEVGDRPALPMPLPTVSNPVQAPASPAERSEGAHQPPKPWPLMLIGLAAAVAVWGGWVELGHLTGFGLVQPLPGVWDELRINTAIVLPVGIEAYGGYALRTWLSSASLSERTRRFARWSALASLAVGAGAQVAAHLMRAGGVTTAPPLVTVLVACVPVAVLGLATGLATLVRRDAIRAAVVGGGR